MLRDANSWWGQFHATQGKPVARALFLTRPFLYVLVTLGLFLGTAVLAVWSQRDVVASAAHSGVLVSANYDPDQASSPDDGGSAALLAAREDGADGNSGSSSSSAGDGNSDGAGGALSQHFFVATARTVRRENLLDFPKLPLSVLQRVESLALTYRGQVHWYRVASWVWHSKSHAEIRSPDNALIVVQNNAVYLKRAYEPEVVADLAGEVVFLLDREVGAA